VTKILIVEDDVDTRNNLFDILELNGYQADTATTAEEAVERAEQADYEIILMDWNLPDYTADNLLPELRRLVPDASIIIATGSSEIENAIHSMQHGASDYIIKPICPEMLLCSIHRAVELRSARQRATQAERLAAIGAVVAGVAHESRNVLHRIGARVDLIRLMNENDASLAEDLEAIEDACDQLQTHFEELREFSAPIVLKKTSCGLRDLVLHVWSNVQCANRSPNAKLSVPETDIQAVFDNVRIEQVMRNLFENAIGASDEPVQIEIDWTVSEFVDDYHLQVSVRDNGPGFTPDQRAAAFAPFYTTKRNGTGLGLAICRRIMEAHGGEIEIDDCQRDGARLMLSLPVRRPAVVQREQ
jgi:signal transduction histidine kinase